MCLRSSQEDGYVEEVYTKNYASSMNSDRSSRSSCQSFETLCFTFTTPQHSEEAWDWFDQTTQPDAKYKGELRATFPNRKHFVFRNKLGMKVAYLKPSNDDLR